MDVSKLKQYGAIKREIKMMERQIERLHSKSGYVADTVVSGSEFPYKKHTVVISGMVDTTEYEAQIRRRISNLSREFEYITAFIDNIKDSRIRQIIQYKYIDGFSWAATATRVYGNPCGDKARMYLKIFLKKF